MELANTVQVDLGRIEPIRLLGERDSNLRRLEAQFSVTAVLRDGVLTLTGTDPHLTWAADVLRELLGRVEQGQAVDIQDVDYLSELREAEGSQAVQDSRPDQELVFDRRTVQLKSKGQLDYVRAIDESDIVFGIGPAGTGKTYLAVAMAVQALRMKRVERIVLTRPAVEAGENLGFLPGTLEEKIDPYLRPLYDALRDFLAFDKLKKYQETGVIEIAPLAYMRGRTLSRSFVVLDEAQNTTVNQMKMFLTRMGPKSYAVITGDITQVDLVNPEESGLIRVKDILRSTEGIEFVYFQNRDVVRHRLVKSILRAFAVYESRNKRGKGKPAEGSGDGSS